MTVETVQPRGYVDEAIEQARQTLRVYEEASPVSARAMRFFIDWMSQAKRVRVGLPLVPEGGEVSMIATTQRYADVAIVNEPLLAIEYEHAGVYDTSTDLTRALSTRRIALVVKMDSEYAVTTAGLHGFVKEPSDQGAILVWSVNHFEEKREWEIAPAVAIIPCAQCLEHLKTQESRFNRMRGRMQDGWSRLARMWTDAGRSVLEGTPMTMRFQDMLPEVLLKLGREDVGRVIRETSMDACWAAFGTLSALSCGNVSIDSESRQLQLMGREPGAKLAPLDPFHGRSVLTWNGQRLWQQGVTVDPSTVA